MKDLLLTFLAAGTALAGMQGCAQIKKPAAQVKAAAVAFAFRSSRAGFAVCRRAVHAPNYVRFSRHPINGFARGADAGNENPHRRGKQKPARSHFGKMATRRRIELQLR